MKTEFTLQEIDAIAEQLVKSVKNKTLCFFGEMGAGKTTLIKALVKRLGGIDYASSPTFGLVNEYHDGSDELLAYHFDFYRIETEAEALDLGFEDYTSSDAWIFIEWPEKITSLLPENSEKVHLRFIDENTRSVELNP
ncbi:tRNA (adenosine(37)-N6)-threonylcarbamoyltransferase complex ATPase subunit type 1 TsaE [Flagellimonas allohymeniacidonis]|uniref:tRNA threonylcarbamoyladenosine biosynthesis protein TsaE n=1 Tax=Flagellimonas allohymeniacidonis TaxID=2517819 RepID=A0A4Q8QJQ7_9FLAO|nr:tRNA (adenosine(37)-N6)-threonylcarbamoyltransferase complex ATPase subunit type 1 TsaE [Allomuricauda hymeniacidonis]TAI48729.1 tRNA (adenosine(37)-N6)-threonylcarbamoyltransferase complex ATPase subunit type 1 TsaE [Allomuricauda hymeniacidonis]